MLDVHVLTMPTTRPAWAAQRRASIDGAIAAAGFPVVLHEIPGVVGHIGKGRAAGYALGVQPYVTYVDDDDWLEPGAFSALHTALLSGHDAICPGETEVLGWHRTKRSTPHHLICYRREVANAFPHKGWAVCGDLALANTTHDRLAVADYSYHHRIYLSGGRRLRAANPNELERANAESAA